MRIVTLDAFLAVQQTARRVPVSIGASVNSVRPVPEDWPVALGAKQLRLVVGNRAALVGCKSVARGSIMAVEATVVDAVLQGYLAVLRKRAIGLPRGGEQLVALGAAIRIAGYGDLRFQGRVANRGRVSCPLGNNSGRGVGSLVRPWVGKQEAGECRETDHYRPYADRMLSGWRGRRIRYWLGHFRASHDTGQRSRFQLSMSGLQPITLIQIK